jgi:hypothetical protein
MKLIKLISALLLLVTLSGCGSSLQMDRGTVQAVANLDKSQYDITGDVQGEASVTWVFFFFPIGTKPQMGTFYNPMMVFPFGSSDGPVHGMAVYNAIENAPGVDMVIAPRYESEVKGFPPFYWTTTVKVKGKGLKLK